MNVNSVVFGGVVGGHTGGSAHIVIPARQKRRMITASPDGSGYGKLLTTDNPTCRQDALGFLDAACGDCAHIGPLEPV